MRNIKNKKYIKDKIDKIIGARTNIKRQSKEELRDILKKAIENTNKINHKRISDANTSS